MRPAIHAKWSITRVVMMHSGRYMYIRDTQLHRTQFCIELNGIDYQRVDPVCLHNCWQRFQYRLGLSQHRANRKLQRVLAPLSQLPALISSTPKAPCAKGGTRCPQRVDKRHCGFAADRQSSFFIAFDKLDKIGREGVLAELRAAGHDPDALTRFERLLPALLDQETSLASLERALTPRAEDLVAFESLAAILAVVAPELPTGARVVFDAALVRGMGYYTGTVFEIGSPAFPASIAGGGRYDKMVGRFLGRDVPACGFSIGFERLIAILGERGDRRGVLARPATEGVRRIALLVNDDTALPRALQAARALREQGDLVSLEVRRKNTRKQLDDLTAHGFSDYGVVEAGKSAATVKPLRQPG